MIYNINSVSIGDLVQPEGANKIGVIAKVKQDESGKRYYVNYNMSDDDLESIVQVSDFYVDHLENVQLFEGELNEYLDDQIIGLEKIINILDEMPQTEKWNRPDIIIGELIDHVREAKIKTIVKKG